MTTSRREFFKGVAKLMAVIAVAPHALVKVSEAKSVINPEWIDAPFEMVYYGGTAGLRNMLPYSDKSNLFHTEPIPYRYTLINNKLVEVKKIIQTK